MTHHRNIVWQQRHQLVKGHKQLHHMTSDRVYDFSAVFNKPSKNVFAPHFGCFLIFNFYDPWVTIRALRAQIRSCPFHLIQKSLRPVPSEISTLNTCLPHKCYVKSTYSICALIIYTYVVSQDTSERNKASPLAVAVHFETVHKYKRCGDSAVEENQQTAMIQHTWCGLHYVQTRTPERSPHKP